MAGAQPSRSRPTSTRLGCDMYLAISHELYLKRLIAAGYDKVFTIGRYFRNEGIDRSHHPEFSMVETMTAYANYEYNMALVEDMFRHIATQRLRQDGVHGQRATSLISASRGGASPCPRRSGKERASISRLRHARGGERAPSRDRGQGAPAERGGGHGPGLRARGRGNPHPADSCLRASDRDLAVGQALRRRPKRSSNGSRFSSRAWNAATTGASRTTR